MRIKQLEFCRNGDNRPPEIIKWSEGDVPYRWTLLFWDKDSEGWFIRFVGDRPLIEEESKSLFELMRYAQTVLDAEFKLMERLA